MQMRLKKLGAALAVVAALGAIMASSAFATATTTAANWYTTASGSNPLSGSLSVTASQEGTGTFTTTVSGKPIKVTATGVECIECSLSNSPAGASGKGKLKFTGVTVDEPAKCTTTSSITTKALVVSADFMEGSAAMVKFTPEAGEEAGFATFELTGSECPLKTTITPKGSVFGKAANATGVLASSQKVAFSPEINSNAGGTLHVGTEAATLTSNGVFTASEAYGAK